MYHVDYSTFTNVIFFWGLHRQISQFKFRDGAFPPTVFGVYVGKWNLNSSPPADAQHWGAASVSGPHPEDGGDQVRPSDYLGGLYKICLWHLLYVYKEVVEP